MLCYVITLEIIFAFPLLHVQGSTSDNEWGVATYAYDSINQRTYESTMQDNANVGQLRLYTEVNTV